jgi:hypothetical protein
MTISKLRRLLSVEIGENISHGTIVQLCVPRNKRYRLSARYHGAANIVSKRACKGFDVKINVDDQWSNALYRSLDMLQHTDNTNIFSLNRDDAAGFRLNTLATANRFHTPMVRVSEDLATRTDFTTKDNSQIQVSSYQFTGSNTTKEDYAGVVKASCSTPKTPSQHASDLRMIGNDPRFVDVFNCPDGSSRLIDAIRVEGGGDENPDHVEQKFLWTEWHFEMGKLATFVSTRFSWGSYLNEVEHLNGQLCRAHANLFIPSTLVGPNKDPLTGEHSAEMVATNLNAAVDIYISRVDNTCFKDNTIKLFRAAPPGDFTERRPILLEYLKANRQKREKLQERYSQDEKVQSWLTHFERVLEIQRAHEINNVKYVFGLLCCFSAECKHPFCTAHIGCSPSDFKWFEGGPPLDFFPWPCSDATKDPRTCEECEKCVGHFMRYPDLVEQYSQGIRVEPGAHLPSSVIGDIFNIRKEIANEKRKTDPSCNIEPLLPPELSLLSQKLCISDNKQ